MDELGGIRTAARTLKLIAIQDRISRGIAFIRCLAIMGYRCLLSTLFAYSVDGNRVLLREALIANLVNDEQNLRSAGALLARVCDCECESI